MLLRGGVNPPGAAAAPYPAVGSTLRGLLLQGGGNPPLAEALLLLRGVNPPYGLNGLLLLRWGGVTSKKRFMKAVPVHALERAVGVLGRHESTFYARLLTFAQETSICFCDPVPA